MCAQLCSTYTYLIGNNNCECRVVYGDLVEIRGILFLGPIDCSVCERHLMVVLEHNRIQILALDFGIQIPAFKYLLWTSLHILVFDGNYRDNCSVNPARVMVFGSILSIQ